MARTGAKLWCLALAVALSACSSDDVILPGEREAVRPLAALPEAADGETEGDVTFPPLRIPPAVAVEDWTHVNGTATHLAPHGVFSQRPRELWSVSLGSGAGRRNRVTAAPVANTEAVFAMDGGARVSAVNREGDVLWRTDITPLGENPFEGFGGGLALAGDRLLVASGFGEVVALNASSGLELWRSPLETSARSAPAIGGDTVVAVGGNDVAFGFDLESGAVLWRLEGTGGDAGILGGGSPAIRGPLTIVPFQTGALTAVLTNSGRTVWNATVSGGRRGLARARLSDITGDPVIDNDIVYTANQAGRMVSLDRRSGERNWTLQEGASGPALPVGGSVFVVTDAAKLVRIDAETGDPIWSQTLPEAQEINNRNVVVPHYGPILAGGRLLVAGGDGMLRSFAPVDGRPLGEVELGGFAAAPPALVGGILFVVCTDGTLRAFQ